MNLPNITDFSAFRSEILLPMTDSDWETYKAEMEDSTLSIGDVMEITGRSRSCIEGNVK